MLFPSLRIGFFPILLYLPILVASYSASQSYSLLSNTTASTYSLPTGTDEWNTLSAARAVSLRTQRDISANITVASNVVIGVNLTETLFEVLGYNSTALLGFRGYLDVGIQAFAIDLYYNKYHNDWGLCPSRAWSNSSTLKCDDSSAFNITSFITTINGFLDDTTTKLDTNTIYLLFKLHTIDVANPRAVTNITDLATPFSTLLYTSSEAVLSQNEIPSLSHLLFTNVVRTIPIVIENNVPVQDFTFETDKKMFYISNAITDTFSNSSTALTLPLLNLHYDYFGDSNCVSSSDFNSTTFRFSYDDNDSPFTIDEFRQTMLCGYTPIINHRFGSVNEIVPYLANSFWTWGAGQPNLTTSDSNYDENDSSYSDPNRCAIITSSGWSSTSCYDEHYTICQSKTDRNDFKALEKKLSFQDATNACSDLDDGWVVAIPDAAVIQKQLIELVSSNYGSSWIDLNSLSAQNCWVVGIDTTCPYQKIINKQVFRRMITPGAIISFVLIGIIISLHFDSVPIHRNRNHWKRLLTEKLKDEYEGVSS